MANGTVAKTAPKPKGEGLFARLKKFIRESYVETRHKSSWPTRAELWQFTLVVLFALLVVSAYIGILDWLMAWITDSNRQGLSKYERETVVSGTHVLGT